ncbi:MAG TPA: Nif3-like dinuclear metal center hexameric protein [Candidatus Hydrogenedentes bacterium]|nr:Nif3-like dinuclear metal center hexameric protein [Candidatus Hydrogenedentota bacterium]
MKVRDVCAAIETLAPLKLACEWDRVGLSIGDPNADVRRVLVVLTVTRGALRAAAKAHANLIVAHHPLMRQPLENLRTDNPVTRLCVDIAGAGIACYVAHTNLDVAPGGMNDLLAARLGLRQPRPLIAAPQNRQVKLVTFVPESHLPAVRRAVCDAGAGVIGDYTYCTFSAPGVGTFLPGDKAQPFSGARHLVNEEPELRFETIVPQARLDRVVGALKSAHPYEEVAYDIVELQNRDAAISLGVQGELPSPMSLNEFARRVRDALKVSHVRVVGAAKKRVCHVAVLGGGGGGEVEHLPRDTDVYVTGDVRYHDALAAAERGLAVVDPGHAGMEKWIVPFLAGYLKRTCKPIKVITYREPELFRFVAE